MATGIYSAAVAKEFLEHACEEHKHGDGAECVGYSVRERHPHGEPVTHVTGCSTRAAALDSSLRAVLATIAIEKIVLAILRRIEKRWQPCQEKADEGKQETYA